MILKYREKEKCALCPSTLFFFFFRGLFLLTGDTHKMDMAFVNNVCAREILFLLVDLFLGVRLGKMLLPKTKKIFKFIYINMLLCIYLVLALLQVQSLGFI